MKDRTKKNDINNNIYIDNNLENKANNQKRKQHFSKIKKKFKYKDIFNNFYYNFIKIIFLLEISSLQLLKLNNINSEIVIIINNGGNQSILSDKYNDLPDYIFMNETQVPTSKTVNLINGKNIIKMIWNHTVTNCSYMFYQLDNIAEVDLSNF